MLKQVICGLMLLTSFSSFAGQESVCGECSVDVVIESEEVYGRFAIIKDGEVREVFSTDRHTSVDSASAACAEMRRLICGLE